MASSRISPSAGSTSCASAICRRRRDHARPPKPRRAAGSSETERGGAGLVALRQNAQRGARPTFSCGHRHWDEIVCPLKLLALPPQRPRLYVSKRLGCPWRRASRAGTLAGGGSKPQMALNHVTLDDKYDLQKSRIFVTGFQAIVRLCLMQKERDRRAGINTAGYVTGYRGSPLGTLDQQFIRAQRSLDKYDIKFQGGINEDIAATALWGSQQAELRGEGKFDGVFGLWYGKGPGVDRTGDVFRHANFAGTSKHGGVLALMGDDHAAESSTTAHQSEYHFIDVMIPILNPAGVQEILDYGLYGWAMSRFCGTWVALKSMHETVESTAVIDGSMERVNIVIPHDFAMPEGGLNIRLRDTILGQEARLHDYKRDAMLAFVRANKLNKYITSGGRRPK